MTTIIVIVIVVVILAVAATLAGTLLLSRRALQQRFGPEYDQLARNVGPRRAQAELTERRRRVAKLDIRPLSAERRESYSRKWMSLQERFVDNPAQSVAAARALVSAAAADRGYPGGDDDRLTSDLSVDYANRLDGYRQAQRITARGDTAGTEELRQALLSYGALFRDLIGVDPAADWPASVAEPAASGAGVPAAEAARDSTARGDAPAGAATTPGDATPAATTPADETGAATARDGEETPAATTPAAGTGAATAPDGEETPAATTPADGTGAATAPDGEETPAATTPDGDAAGAAPAGDETWADSGQEDHAAARAARRE